MSAEREVAVAIITGPADEDGVVETPLFGTTVPALEQTPRVAPPEGLHQCGHGKHGIVLDTGKEYPRRRGAHRAGLPKEHHPEPGDKTDFRDAMNLAHLHRHGLLKGSFLPLIQQMEEPTAAEQAQTRPMVIRRASPAKVCRGALGFRARQTRKQEYSVVNDPSAGAPRQRRPETERLHAERFVSVGKRSRSIEAVPIRGYTEEDNFTTKSDRKRSGERRDSLST